MKKLRILCEATSENRPSFDGRIVIPHFTLEFRFEVLNGTFGLRSRVLVISMDANNYDNDELLRSMLLQRKRIDIEVYSEPEERGEFTCIEYVGEAEEFLKWLKLDINEQFNTAAIENRLRLSM